jgi:acetyltransferase
MSQKNLDILFNPQSIAVIGENEDDTSIGYHICKNLIGKGFKGIVHPVNPAMHGAQGVEAYRTVSDIPSPVDLALVASNPEHLQPVLKSCGEKGIKGIIILAPDYTYRVKHPALVNEQIRELSAVYGCRVLGPNSLGFIRPAIHLNASLFPLIPQEGNIAFISESGVFSTTFLEHAISKNIGFSYFISLGSKFDINIADTIDFLGGDGGTRAIFLFLKTINNGRRFLTAARNVARKNPIMIVKPGRAGVFSCHSLPDADSLIEEDLIYDALFKRAGCLRVDSIVDLLYMVETTAKQNRPKDKRLMIISNSIAPSEMAMDALKGMGGLPAIPDQKNLEKISAALAIRRDLDNPLYLQADASAADYQVAIENCLQDNEIDGILVICVPFPGIDQRKIAKTIALAAKKQPKIPLFCTWYGEATVLDEKSLKKDGIPIYFTPEQAVKSFMYMYRYDYNLKLLQETPEVINKNFSPRLDEAKKIIDDCMDQKRYTLHAEEAAEILRAYGIPVIDTVPVRDEEEAVQISRGIGYPVTMKIDTAISSGINREEMAFVHLKDDHEVRKVFTILQARVVSLKDPEARVIIQPMIMRHGYELVIGAQKNLSLGTVIRFGLGGKYLKAERDYSVGLPPLNQTLARRMMEETKIYHCLQERYSLQEGGLRFLEEILVRFSQLIIDLPQIGVIDINPLMLMDDDCMVRDVTMQIDKNLPKNYRWAKGDLCPLHLSIPPYPFKYEKDVPLKNGRVIHIRPIRGEDEPALRRFFESLSEESVFFRFGQRRINMPHDHLARLCQVDYDRDLAFLATIPGDEENIIGDVRLNRFSDLERAELSFVVADKWQGKGVGNLLMDFCIVVAKEIGLKTLLMEVMKSNERMKRFSYKYGFQRLPSGKEDDMEEFELKIGRSGNLQYPSAIFRCKTAKQAIT